MTAAGTPLGGHLLHAVPLLVPVVAVAAVLLPDLLRRGLRAVLRRPTARPPAPALLAAAGSLVACGVHLVVLPEHLEEAPLYGVFFALLAAGQAVYAWCLVLGPPRPLLDAGVVGNASVVALWLVTRTAGLPFGPFAGQVEPVGALDLTAVAAELVVLAACGALLLGAGGDALQTTTNSPLEPQLHHPVQAGYGGPELDDVVQPRAVSCAAEGHRAAVVP